MREVANRNPVKRLVRSYGFDRRFEHPDGVTKMNYFNPEIRNGNIYDDGLDSKIDLGAVDMEKLGNPTRIKVTITKLD